MTLPKIPGQRPDQDRAALLWPDGAPESEGAGYLHEPMLSIHLPDKAVTNGAAVIINPGGGYRILASDHEGLQMARLLNRHGIAAFVLRYRLGPAYPTGVSLLDAQRAVRYVRYHAGDLGVDRDRIGMLGFSAGGHLAAMAGTKFDHGDETAIDPVDRQPCRPDFLALIYAAISDEFFNAEVNSFPPTQHDVDGTTPPTFLISTHEDRVVSPLHSLAFYQALLAHQVPSELHVFGFGGHGTGLGTGDPHLKQWTSLLTSWLTRVGMLSSRRRQPLAGSVELNDAALFWGWLTLMPEDPADPMICIYLHQGSKGKFELDLAQGPVPGLYYAVLHVVAMDFSEPQSGRYSMADAICIEKQTADDESAYSVNITEDVSRIELQFWHTIETG
jgi:acetyl esterase/lipase